jgi:hypothetical protein
MVVELAIPGCAHGQGSWVMCCTPMRGCVPLGREPRNAGHAIVLHVHLLWGWTVVSPLASLAWLPGWPICASTWTVVLLPRGLHRGLFYFSSSWWLSPFICRWDQLLPLLCLSMSMQYLLLVIKSVEFIISWSICMHDMNSSWGILVTRRFLKLMCARATRPIFSP